MKKLIIIVSVLALATPAWASYSSVVMADNPQAFFEFNDSASSNGASCVDTTGGHNGTYKNTGTGADIQLVDSGRALLGQCAQFNGTVGSGKGDFVDVGNSNGYYGTLDGVNMSVEEWVRGSNLQNYPRTIQHCEGSTANWGLGATNGTSDHDGSGQLMIMGAGATQYTWPGLSWDGLDWSYVVVTYSYDDPTNKTTIKWYQDHNLIQTIVKSGYLDASGLDKWDDVIIGAEGNQYYVYNGYGSGGYPELIDEIAVYTYTLNQDQITAHWNAATPEPATIALLCLGSLALLRKRS